MNHATQIVNDGRTYHPVGDWSVIFVAVQDDRAYLLHRRPVLAKHPAPIPISVLG
jgi:hypothetical protein